MCTTRERCFDPRDGHPIELGGSVLAAYQHHVLVGNGEAFAWLDLASGLRTPLPDLYGDRGPGSGSMVVVGDQVFDLASGKVVGEVGGWPLALDGRGRALFAAVDLDWSKYHWAAVAAIGPLRWVESAP